ncbi:nucleopolyhedrovirus P10 family protein [Streptomyces sp. CA-294286]|uniref:nucleopolyhedrovirus P10 family protein n=1 Tax=Streptomyces sp. CA-294286 TaxID=3240070 RepID=UPI003D8E7F45
MASTAPDEGWTQAVRQRLGLGRLLPLGGPGDGVWIAERAADRVLRLAGRSVDGTALGALRVGLAEPDAVPGSPAVPPPPGSLPLGPLCVTAEFRATPHEPIPYTAKRLRSALFAAAADRLGLEVVEVDLRVTGLLGDVPDRPEAEKQPPAGPPGRQNGVPAADGPEALAALGVPGVARLTTVLGTRPVTHDTAPPGGHVLVEVAVTGERRALEVALEVRARVAGAVQGHPSVAVLITEVVTDGMA